MKAACPKSQSMLNIVDRKMDEDVHCVVLHSKSFFSWLTSQRAGIGQHPPNALQNALRFSTILAGPPVRITASRRFRSESYWIPSQSIWCSREVRVREGNYSSHSFSVVRLLSQHTTSHARFFWAKTAFTTSKQKESYPISLFFTKVIHTHPNLYFFQPWARNIFQL